MQTFIALFTVLYHFPMASCKPLIIGTPQFHHFTYVIYSVCKLVLFVNIAVILFT